jgi:hypothetical protein
MTSTRPNFRNRCVDQLLQFTDIADVGVNTNGAFSQSRYLLFHCVCCLGMRDIINHHAGALLGEFQHNGLADTAIATGDDCKLCFGATCRPLSQAIATVLVKYGELV